MPTITQPQAIGPAASGLRWCPKCSTFLLDEQFYLKSRASGKRHGYCKTCYAAYHKALYQSNPEYRQREIDKAKERNKKIDRPVLYARIRKYTSKVRAEGIVAYGGKCACCGESRPEFMTIDHINGREPGDNRGGKGIMMYLRKMGWPKDNYQLLCFNCNCAKGYMGRCPHEDERGTDAGSK